MASRPRDPATGRFVSANGLAANDTDWIDRIRFARRAGLQYGTERNVYKVAGYVSEGSLRFSDYKSKYERQDIAGRIVDMAAQTTWRNPPEVWETDREGEATAFTDAFNAMRERLRLWHRFERADRLAGIGRYGVLLLGTRGTADASLESPLGRLRDPEDVIYLSAFHEGHVEIKRWIQDPGDPRFGMPEVYEIELSSGVEGFEASKRLVHHSRVLHIAEDLLEDEVYGRPRLKRVMNLLNDLEKITAATAEAYWQLADKILVAGIDPQARTSDDARKALGEALQEIMHDLRRQIVGQGLELDWLGGDAPNPMDAAKLYMMLIGGASGIPHRVLFGNETGERSSSEDQKQWLGTVKERTERFAEPTILRAFIDRMIESGALPRPANGYVCVWPTLWEEPDSEVADVDLKRAQAAKALTPVGGDPTALVEIDEDGRVKLVPRKAGEASPFDLPKEEGDPTEGLTEEDDPDMDRAA